MLQTVRYSLALTVLAPLAGCGSELAVGPEDGAAIAAAPPAAAAARAVDLGACPQLSAPEGSTLVFHAYARGSQVYRWNGQTWLFDGPAATLYADAGGTGVVGSHYAGPTWEANAGGFIVGRVSMPCPVDPADVPWLLLDVVRDEGPGVFKGVTHIQRLNTTGGQIPAGSGSYPGEVRNVPYTAEYFFYRAP
jgi:hypothetical protein